MNITELKGIGAKTAENFNRLSVYTVSDLVGLYPRDYDVYHEPVFVKDISHESEHTELAVEGQVCKSPDIYGSGRLKILTVTIKDYNGDSIKCSWYNMPFLKNTLRLGTRYVFRGRLVNKRGWLLEQPKMYTLAQYKELQGTLQPIYPLTKGLTNNTVTKAVAQALEKYSAGLEKEYIPDYIRKRYSLAEHNFSVVNIHFPKTMEEYVQARHRLAFEEFFLFTLATLSLKSANERIPNSYVIPESKEKNQFLESLSYSLTNAQLRTVSEVAQDMSGEHLCSRLIQGDVGSGKTVVATIAQSRALNEVIDDMVSENMMNRLVQGDVGSGKTIVAVLVLALSVLNGYQGALMAPTEVLARQHYESFVKGFEKAGLDIRVELLVGSMTAKQKKEAYARIADGTAGIIVGTHALIQEKVEYKELALVITDEQHRFGVNQRRDFSQKGKSPHILVMSATPIPRTLAIILYGDLDISIIDEMPANRLPIKNCVVDESYRPKAYAFIHKQVASGRQCYVICPMVEDSEAVEAENVVDYTAMLKKELPDIRIEYLHGKMRPSLKNEVMERFAAHETDVLVSTTVIEVGVNVPNSTVMMVENSERFGLAQLHQLRGRVGRGEYQSYCIFVTGNKSEKIRKRLEILNKSNDGFKIAEEDLRLRGPGDFFGVRQSGDFDFGIADVFTDAKTLKEVAAYTPLDRIVLETDCPYLSPEPNRGKRNSSLNLNYVAEALSQIKGINKEELIAVTEENARQLYRMKEV